MTDKKIEEIKMYIFRDVLNRSGRCIIRTDKEQLRDGWEYIGELLNTEVQKAVEKQAVDILGRGHGTRRRIEINGKYWCYSCHELKPANEFYNNSATKLKKYARCRLCASKARNEHRRKARNKRVFNLQSLDKEDELQETREATQ